MHTSPFCYLTFGFWPLQAEYVFWCYSFFLNDFFFWLEVLPSNGSGRAGLAWAVHRGVRGWEEPLALPMESSLSTGCLRIPFPRPSPVTQRWDGASRCKVIVIKIAISITAPNAAGGSQLPCLSEPSSPHTPGVCQNPPNIPALLLNKSYPSTAG